MYFLKSMLTGVDNETHDFGRYIGVLSILVALGLQVYVVVFKGQSFDLQNYGIGIGALVAGLGAMLKLKESTEPVAAVEAGVQK